MGHPADIVPIAGATSARPTNGGTPEPAADLPDLADAALLVIPPDVDAWYIVGLIRPGKLVYLASGEGVGKSYVRKEAELRLAAGHGVLIGHYPIAGPVRVGTIDEENGPDEEWRRE